MFYLLDLQTETSNIIFILYCCGICILFFHFKHSKKKAFKTGSFACNIKNFSLHLVVVVFFMKGCKKGNHYSDMHRPVDFGEIMPKLTHSHNVKPQLIISENKLHLLYGKLMRGMTSSSVAITDWRKLANSSAAAGRQWTVPVNVHMVACLSKMNTDVQGLF